MPFDVRLDDYREGDRTFYSNDRDPRLPANIAAHVQAVIGLNNIALPVHVGATEVVLPPQYDPKGNLARSCWYAATLARGGAPAPVCDWRIKRLLLHGPATQHA